MNNDLENLKREFNRLTNQLEILTMHYENAYDEKIINRLEKEIDEKDYEIGKCEEAAFSLAKKLRGGKLNNGQRIQYFMYFYQISYKEAEEWSRLYTEEF